MSIELIESSLGLNIFLQIMNFIFYFICARLYLNNKFLHLLNEIRQNNDLIHI